MICPHCWEGFPPEKVLWISEHSDLRGDPRLGQEEQQRFLPTRFSTTCDAIDASGVTCRSLACPHCHLVVPRASLEMDTLFLSVLGASSSGKSYFLAAMTSQLREVLPFHFSVTLTDVDPAINRLLNLWEESLSHNPHPDRFISLGDLIGKTELEGGMYYDSVRYGHQVVRYPRPFLFSIHPQPTHPQAQGPNAPSLTRLLCLYDNAGEHFEPGRDDQTTPVTRHLAKSQGLLFVFDPTQDQKFRGALKAKGVEVRTSSSSRFSRQSIILNEAASRVRRHAGLGQSEKHDRPLIIVLTKFDQWGSLFPTGDTSPPWYKVGSDPNVPAGLDVERIEERSKLLRQLMVDYCSELVAAAEGFAKEVTYIAVSSLGPNIEVDPGTGVVGIRPEMIQPQWVTVPFQYCLTKVMPGLLFKLKRRPPGDDRRSPTRASGLSRRRFRPEDVRR